MRAFGCHSSDLSVSAEGAFNDCDAPRVEPTRRTSLTRCGTLAETFSVEQVFELIALIGFYHTVSFFANGLRLARLAPEPYGVPFPPR
jgi:hypothetical protein